MVTANQPLITCYLSFPLISKGLVGFTSTSMPVVSQPPVTTTFHQQLHHPPEPKPTKSSGKSKVNKHPSEQGLNEEQKHAIVMQNVKNILSQQANWNKVS